MGNNALPGHDNDLLQACKSKELGGSILGSNIEHPRRIIPNMDNNKRKHRRKQNKEKPKRDITNPGNIPNIERKTKYMDTKTYKRKNNYINEADVTKCPSCKLESEENRLKIKDHEKTSIRIVHKPEGSTELQHLTTFITTTNQIGYIPTHYIPTFIKKYGKTPYWQFNSFYERVAREAKTRIKAIFPYKELNRNGLDIKVKCKTVEYTTLEWGERRFMAYIDLPISKKNWPTPKHIKNFITDRGLSDFDGHLTIQVTIEMIKPISPGTQRQEINTNSTQDTNTSRLG